VSHLEIVKSELQNFQIELPAEQVGKLSLYCDELVHWNRKLNLTGLSGAPLVRRLVVEPVWIARELGLQGSLVDIGSGNGSPAIPFQIVSSLSQGHLVEARLKRAAFLRHVIGTLGLATTVVHRTRFEDIAKTLGKCDWVSLQAVAFTEELLGSIEEIAHPTTTIVWITSAETTVFRPSFRNLSVPWTGTRVLLFRLDLP
jgi:16S rRNA (guanine(527)-N(7))-methyltransferase RsmG